MSKSHYLRKNYFLQPFTLFALLVFVFCFSACNDSEKTAYTYFGGKIKNPKGKYVYLNKGKKILDSARIDNHNKFSFQLDSVKLGLYTFKHGAEFQYIYLEPKDSLLLYLNTWDFDESLIFSGKGTKSPTYGCQMHSLFTYPFPRDRSKLLLKKRL